MPRKIALVDYNKCRADLCGVCPASAACPKKVLVQESSGETPMADPVLCRGCGDCVRACPLKAVEVLNQ